LDGVESRVGKPSSEKGCGCLHRHCSPPQGKLPLYHHLFELIHSIPQFFHFLEEAVKAQTATSGRLKSKKKELINPFLIQKEPVESDEVADKQSLSTTKSDTYPVAEALRRLDLRSTSRVNLYGTCSQWAPQSHQLPGGASVGNAAGIVSFILSFAMYLLNFHHQMDNTADIDLNTPPDVQYFNFFHSKPGGANQVASDIVR
jgi:hypothetical protein